MVRLFLTLAFSMPSLVVIRAAMGDSLELYESLSAGMVAAMFSQIWVRSLER